jgi:hypothetical protein
MASRDARPSVRARINPVLAQGQLEVGNLHRHAENRLKSLSRCSLAQTVTRKLGSETRRGVPANAKHKFSVNAPPTSDGGWITSGCIHVLTLTGFLQGARCNARGQARRSVRAHTGAGTESINRPRAPVVVEGKFSTCSLLHLCLRGPVANLRVIFTGRRHSQCRAPVYCSGAGLLKSSFIRWQSFQFSNYAPHLADTFPERRGLRTSLGFEKKFSSKR